MTANNGQAGCQYDVKALNAIQLIGFEIHSRKAGTTVNAEVYTKTGSYKGFQTNAAAWTLIQKIAVKSNGEGLFTPLPLLPKPLVIPAGAIQAFYVTLDSADMRYTNGNNLGALYKSDNNLQFFQGVGTTYPFGSIFSPRIWNGRIKCVQSTSARIDPTPRPSPAPTSSPIRALETTMADGNGQGGNQFSLIATNAIEIVGFEIHSRKNSTVKAEVYTKAGSFEGFEQNATAWTLIQTEFVPNKGIDVLTPLPPLPSPIKIHAGNLQSFYVTLTTNDIRYTNGDKIGAVFISDDNLQFLEGTGNIYPFGTSYAPRVWNGRIKYRRVPNSEIPPGTTISPTIQDPIFEPTPQPVLEFTMAPSADPVSDMSNEPSTYPKTESLEPTAEQPSNESLEPTAKSFEPSTKPTPDISSEPLPTPTKESMEPTVAPTIEPTSATSMEPTKASMKPTTAPSEKESQEPSSKPSGEPSLAFAPIERESSTPSKSLSSTRSEEPSLEPTSDTSLQPSLATSF